MTLVAMFATDLCIPKIKHEILETKSDFHLRILYYSRTTKVLNLEPKHISGLEHQLEPARKHFLQDLRLYS